MGKLKTLAQNRDAILLAELAGLLHNIGKLNPNFLRSTVDNEGAAVKLLKQHSQFVGEYAFKRFAKPSEDILDPSVRTFLANSQKLDVSQLSNNFTSDLEIKQKKAAETFHKFYGGVGPLNDKQAQSFNKMRLEVSGEKWQLTNLLTLFWDDFFHKPNNSDYQRTYALDRWLNSKPNGLPHLLIHAHGEMSGSEKYQIAVDEDTGTIITQGVKQKETSFKNLRIATAFGYEIPICVWNLQSKQQTLINHISGLSLDDDKWRLQFQAALRHGLGDTQRPINEITLWDYASSIAALFKTSIAKSFLEGTVADANQMHWRLLGVRFDGLDYILQATSTADLLGRQQKYQEILNQIRVALTQETPVASQVYQDENGLFFVVPDSHKLGLEDLQTLINEQLQQRRFEDLRPHIGWSRNLRGKQLNLGQEIKHQDEARRPSIDPKKVEEWWQNSATEICTVCSLRPVISRETNYCFTCKSNRQSRVQPWLSAFNSTIWLDEVADGNGRLALLTGQFPLNNWLDGTLVESLALRMNQEEKPVSKFASFPRIQRIWQTTQAFWEETEANINQTLTDARRRLIITLGNQPGLKENQTYELDLLGQTRMSVLWGGNYLLSIDNLSYIASQLGFPLKDSQTGAKRTPEDLALDVGTWLEQHKSKPGQKQIFLLISDDEKNRRFDIQIADVKYQDAAYATAIPILAQPRTFMALVPADKALSILDVIRAKYEREMGKVRNRLPLHLGVVYFQRRTPLRAVLDAGRRMLRYESRMMQDEVWTVKRVDPTGKLPGGKAYLIDGTQQFDQTIAVELERKDRSLTWYVPARMGDGQTDDNWYPYVFVKSNVNGRPQTFKARRPKSDGSSASEECWLIHAGRLQASDQVYFTPATLDFEWLDSAGRRFEIAYDENGRRRNHLIRPYLLDELDTLQEAWKLISEADGLSSSQIYALRDLIETKRESWQPMANNWEVDCRPPVVGEDGRVTQEAGMFWQFCRDAVVNANWKKERGKLDERDKPDKSNKPTKEQVDRLTNWAVSGLFTDVIQVYMGIMKEKPHREE